MQVTQTITLNENQIKELLIKALKLDATSTISFSHSAGDQRERSYTSITITTKTDIET